MYKIIDYNVKEFTDDQGRKLLYENMLDFLNQDYGCSFDYEGGILSKEDSEEVVRLVKNIDISDRIVDKCICDFYKVIMVTGCKCGYMKKEQKGG
jgi:hypothetical protein